jgi:hypothetical protein
VEDCHGDTYATFPKTDVVYVSSHEHYCGNLPDGFAQTDPWTYHFVTAFSKAATGTLTADPHGYANWAGNPSPSLLKWVPRLETGTFTGQFQATWTVTGNNNYVVFGGEFPTAGGQPQQGLVRYATKAIAPNKIGPEVTQSKFNPTLTSNAQGTVHLSWRANWDRDNEQLTYQVIRNSDLIHPIYQTTTPSSEWNRPIMTFTDTALVAGSTYRYRVFAHDPLGNETRSDTGTIVASTTGTLSPYASAVFGDHPNSYWRLGEPSGATVQDWAGVTNATAATGVLRGVSGAIPGDTNKASTFNGSSSGFAAQTARQVAPDLFSVEAWFKTGTSRGGKIIGFGDASAGESEVYDRHVYMSDNGRVTFGVHPGTSRTLTSPTAYNNNQWHHVVATLGSAGMALWLDGTLVGSRADTKSGSPYSGVWRIGGDRLKSWVGAPASNYFAGNIDDAAVYPTALTSAQVVRHYDVGH